jgi:hypothetical protein
LVKGLIEILTDCGVVDNDRLESMWRAECAKLDEKTAAASPATMPPKKTRKAKRKASAGG